MNSRKLEFVVGLFVLTGLAAVIFLAVRIGGGRLVTGDSYELRARFTNASGLKKGSSVNLAGVTVGEVVRIDLDRRSFVAVATLRLPADLRLDDDSTAAIKSAGLIGEKFLSLKPGASGVQLQPGELIVDTESSVDLEDLISRFAFGSVDKK